MQQQALAEEFERHRPRLRAVALRLLGSPTDAEDAVQDTWLRADRADLRDVRNLGAWLTTTVSRICLDQLRGRARAATEPLPEEPVATDDIAPDGRPEADVVLADTVREAFLVVLDSLRPAERVAFVLHDAFAVPFSEIALVLGRSPGAAKKLAGRARMKLRERPPTAVDPEALARTHPVLEAFLAAVRAGDIVALTHLLDPDVVRDADSCLLPAGVPGRLSGRDAVLDEARTSAGRARNAQLVVVDGVLGAAVLERGHPRLVLRFTLVGHRITALEIIGAPQRLHRLTITRLP